MIRPPNDLPEIYVCSEPVDLRKQINGLAELVEGELELDPFSAKIFAFTNRRRDRCKPLVWARNGFVLWQKRLERERFHWPRIGEATMVLTGQHPNWLLDGFDLAQ